MDLKQIKGVEIFSTGKWNGDNYTREDLEEMVLAFEETKSGARPYIKLGHDAKQKLLQADGLPAAGWIDRVYIQGDKLMADFVDIPSKVYALIKQKAYRKVSSEIFWNIKIGAKTYKRMLAAVALLGSDTPGVMNLSDILALYNQKDNFEKLAQIDEIDLYSLDLDLTKKENVNMKTEAELKLEAELALEKKQKEESETQLKEFKAKQEAIDKELSDLKTFKAEAEKEKLKLLEEKETAETEKWFSELSQEGLATPAMKEFVMEVVGPEKKTYTSKNLNKKDVLKEILKLFKAGSGVNLDEGSQGGDKGKKDAELAAEMDKKAKAYAKEKNVSYGQAMKVVMKDSKK